MCVLVYRSTKRRLELNQIQGAYETPMPTEASLREETHHSLTNRYAFSMQATSDGNDPS